MTPLPGEARERAGVRVEEERSRNPVSLLLTERSCYPTGSQLPLGCAGSWGMSFVLALLPTCLSNTIRLPCGQSQLTPRGVPGELSSSYAGDEAT